MTRDINVGGHQIDLMASKHISGAGLFSIMVEAKTRTANVGINEVTPFINTAGDLLRAGNIQSAIFVTDTKFSQDAQLAISTKPGMRLTTINDLEQDLFNYSESLLKVVHDYEQDSIYHEYIELDGQRESRQYTYQISDVAEYIRNWCLQGESLLVICGDFGSGKTTALERVRYQQARSYLRSNGKFFPLSFRLRSLLQYPDLWTFIAASLRDNNHISPTRQVFETQLGAGKFLILLDGFDEIETGANALARCAEGVGAL